MLYTSHRVNLNTSVDLTKFLRGHQTNIESGPLVLPQGIRQRGYELSHFTSLSDLHHIWTPNQRNVECSVSFSPLTSVRYCGHPSSSLLCLPFLGPFPLHTSMITGTADAERQNLLVSASLKTSSFRMVSKINPYPYPPSSSFPSLSSRIPNPFFQPTITILTLAFGA